MEKVKLGIVGLGRLGRNHARNICFGIPEAELAAVCSAVPAELDEVCAEMHPRWRYDDYREMFQNKELDGVVIASNSQVHCEMAIEAARLGVKNVYIEKPLAMTMDEARAIKTAVEKSDIRIFQVGYNRRFDKSYRAVKEKIEAGYIGTPVLVKMINRDPASLSEFIIKFSPTSGGLVFDMLTHDYDAARWFLGSDAETVYGLGGVYAYEGLRAVGDIDNCGILCRFGGGAMGWFETSRSSPYGYQAEAEIFGTEGCLRVCATPTNDRVVSLDKGGIHQSTLTWFYEYWEPTFTAELKSFVGAVSGGHPLMGAGLMDGYKAVEWALAAKRAVDEETIVSI